MRFFDLKTTAINGDAVDLARYAGQKVLVVNTASKCGYTPQYAQLEELYQRYKDKGLVVLGFPSNEFGGQEPGTAEEIVEFCQINYGVTFPIMAKLSTKGKKQDPVYAWLTSKEQNGVLDSEVKWNFQKYLIDEQGRLVAMHPSAQEPLSAPIIDWIEGR